MRRLCCSLASVAVFLSPGFAAAGDRASEVDRLAKEGARRWQDGTFAQHRKAIELLEQAAKLAPRDLKVQSQLAHAYLDAGFTHSAKDIFERIAGMAPDSADGYDGLGRVWKRTWLATLDREPLERSVRYLNEAAHRDASRGDVWTQIAVLQLERARVPSRPPPTPWGRCSQPASSAISGGISWRLRACTRSRWPGCRERSSSAFVTSGRSSPAPMVRRSPNFRRRATPRPCAGSGA